MRSSWIRALTCLVGPILFVFPGAQAQDVNTLGPDLTRKVTAAIQDVMTRTAVPSVVVGIVRDGHIDYVAAFGQATLSPPRPATTAMHYPIGSISKQFTAAAVLLLQQEGRLSLDDPVARWFPELTRAGDVTVRELLSHTSGYSDYAPQDYTIPEWLKPTTADRIVHEWATKPLDFEPGSQYQYSNTNFNIAGLIIEKVSGEPFWSFLQSRVLEPLNLRDTLDTDTQRDRIEPTGYFRHALGPLRPLPLEGPGWYTADAAMAMPVGELLRWDIALIDRKLLSAASYAAMETPTRLKDGLDSNYGLGLQIGTLNGHREVFHGGEVGGFVASNTIFPDDRIAIAVLTNQEASPAAKLTSDALAALLVPGTQPHGAAVDDFAHEMATARQVLAGLQQGRIDRSLFTANANFYFDDTAVADYASSLKPLGALRELSERRSALRGGMRYRNFSAVFANGTTLAVSTFWTLDGRIEQFLVEPLD